MTTTSTLTQPATASSVATNMTQWRRLYQVAALAAALALLNIPLSVLVFVVWPPPENVVGHFAAYQISPLQGMAGLDILYLLINLLLVPSWLALYVLLRRVNPSAILLAVAVGLLATALLFPTRPLVEMGHLSNLYTGGSAAEQAAALGAGEALLAIYNGTSYHLHYILGSLALIIVALVMLQSNLFDRRVAYVGLAANIITLGFYLPEIGLYLSIFSALFYAIWYAALARRFWQLSRAAS